MLYPIQKIVLFIKSLLVANMKEAAVKSEKENQIFLLAEIQAEGWEFEKDTIVLFIGFKQAFDGIKSILTIWERQQKEGENK